MAADDPREDGSERMEKGGSPQGWEEGKNEGITFPPLQGKYILQMKHKLNPLPNVIP